MVTITTASAADKGPNIPDRAVVIHFRSRLMISTPDTLDQSARHRLIRSSRTVSAILVPMDGVASIGTRKGRRH